MPRTPGWIVFSALLLIAVVTFFVLPPHISSDSFSYLDTMTVIMGGDVPTGFVPNRILTTFLGLITIITAGFVIVGDIMASWYAINVLLFILGMSAFFYFLREFLEDERAAWVGTLLLATNYATISFGLNYLMDMGGWAAYLGTVWAAYRYYTTGKKGYLVAGAFMVGLGGLWKEYAFLGAVPLFGSLLARDYKTPKAWIPRALQLAIIIAVPIGLLYWHVYTVYGYTYGTWLGFNKAVYGASYGSQIAEYIKVFGSLLTFAWFLVLPGLFLVLRRGKEILGNKKVWFLGFVFLSGLPIFFWPAITQRVFFVSIVFCATLAALAVREYKKYFPYFVSILLLYVVAGYTMDAYILPAVNLGALL